MSPYKKSSSSSATTYILQKSFAVSMSRCAQEKTIPCKRKGMGPPTAFMTRPYRLSFRSTALRRRSFFRERDLTDKGFRILIINAVVILPLH